MSYTNYENWWEKEYLEGTVRDVVEDTGSGEVGGGGVLLEAKRPYTEADHLPACSA
jgi:hypothetical protein